MQPAITQQEILGLLACQLPTVPEAELRPVSVALHLIIKAGSGYVPQLTKSPSKPRQYKEKSVAESQKLKR